MHDPGETCSSLRGNQPRGTADQSSATPRPLSRSFGLSTLTMDTAEFEPLSAVTTGRPESIRSVLFLPINWTRYVVDITLGPFRSNVDRAVLHAVFVERAAREQRFTARFCGARARRAKPAPSARVASHCSCFLARAGSSRANHPALLQAAHRGPRE